MKNIYVENYFFLLKNEVKASEKNNKVMKKFNNQFLKILKFHDVILFSIQGKGNFNKRRV